MSLFEITKDIIIPLLGVVSTIVIGVIIAIQLKKREERTKIKSLLIDSYMIFLNKQQSFFLHQANASKYQIFKDIYINYEDYFISHANSHVAKKCISEVRDKISDKLESSNLDEINWTTFTYQFSFLLGIKNYDRHVRDLESVILNEYFKENAIDNFLNQLKFEVRNNSKVRAAMSSANIFEVKDAIDTIEELVEREYTSFQYVIFNPYSSKLADLIDRY